MLLVICSNQGLTNTLINYYTYEVNNKLILFVVKIPEDLHIYTKILTLDFYQDFFDITIEIDKLLF